MISEFRHKENLALLAWYRRVGRSLPWRETTDPYAIWVSEVMLQQTQVATVLPYYERWFDRFPTVESLAEAEEDAVFQAWQGLGYYRRARNLHAGAKIIAEQGWPDSHDAWLAMPGIGLYSAAALASICLGEKRAVMDGNVARVFARFTAHEGTGARLKQAAYTWANDQIDSDHPAQWNQAIMELGATVCNPRAPRCGECPWQEFCVARQTWRVDRFPVKVARKDPKPLTWVVAIPWNGSQIGLQRAGDDGWWPNLWEFPHAGLELWPNGPECFEGEWSEYVGRVPHTVTHHKLSLEVWLLRTLETRDWTWADLSSVDQFAMPSAMRKCLKLARLAF